MVKSVGVWAVGLALLLATASAASLATEQGAQGLGEYVRHKVGDVVGTVKGKIGSEWGGSKVEEAEAEIPGKAGEIEYVRISKGGQSGEMMPGNVFTRTWRGISDSLGWAGRKAEQGAEDMYDAAVGVKNKAGQTWNDGAASDMADTASDAYQRALKAVHDKWTASGGDSSGQTWGTVASAFRSQWRAASYLASRVI